MTALRSLYHLVRADFLERTRRYSFLIVLGLTVSAGYAFAPPAGAKYAAMALGDFRGLYNSAWVGTLVAIMTSICLSLAGFYLVKDTLERDERTGVGPIIAATPLSKLLYVVGKTLSNLAVLAAMAAVLALVALAMQLLRGEDSQLNLWALWSPFVFIVLPGLSVVAATAVLFETLPWLRGGFGNIGYVVVWMVVLITGTILPPKDKNDPLPINDVFGINTPLGHMTAAASAAYPAYDGTVTIGISVAQSDALALQTFRWDGMAWTPAQVGGRLLWVGAALGLALLAALCFNRFDTTSGSTRRGKPLRPNLRPTPRGLTDVRPEPAARPEGMLALSAASLSPAPLRFNPVSVLHADLRLLLKGQPWWWYAGALGLIVAGLLAPPETARQVVLPLAWIWPVLVWSGLGSREARHATGALVFSAARPLARQLPAAWLAGVTVAAVAGSGVVVTLVRAGDSPGVAAWVAGAGFIPALALALGAWSGGSKLFEVLYVLWWYTGPVNSLPGMDFVGTRTEALWPAYLVLTLALLAAATAGRWRSLRYA